MGCNLLMKTIGQSMVDKIRKLTTENVMLVFSVNSRYVMLVFSMYSHYPIKYVALQDFIVARYCFTSSVLSIIP